VKREVSWMPHAPVEAKKGIKKKGCSRPQIILKKYTTMHLWKTFGGDVYWIRLYQDRTYNGILW
jgi:hypothetical protein